MAELLASLPPTRRLPKGRHGASAGAAGVVLTERSEPVATVASRKGAIAATIDRLAARFGLAPQDRPVAVLAEGVAVVGVGPGRWTLVGAAIADAEATLGPALEGVAAVIDQSGGQVVFDLTGPAVEEVMASLVAIDLDPSVFPVGAAATTTVAHVGVTLWRTGEGFVFLVGRSFAVAFERAVVASAERLGVVLA